MHVTVTTLIFGLPEGQRLVSTHFIVPTATLTVRELIARKIEQEVAECLACTRPGLSGEYLSPEVLINATTRDALAPGAVDAEIVRAQRAFAARDYMIVIDEQRLFDPDRVMTLLPETRIEFIKILPLVGG
jgi:hypothetical protein